MSEEKDWAKFYRQHKDDPEMWGEPEDDAPPVRRSGLSTSITVRFSPEEAAAIREVAQELGVPYSEIVRRAVRKFVHFRLVTEDAVRDESQESHDLWLSNAATSTGSLAFAHG